MRIWGKIIKDNRMLVDTVVEDNTIDTRTHKIFRALDEICYVFDLGKPIWLDSTVAEFKRHDKARFYQDNFIEQIDFDYLEFHVIEEDSWRRYKEENAAAARHTQSRRFLLYTTCFYSSNLTLIYAFISSTHFSNPSLLLFRHKS